MHFQLPCSPVPMMLGSMFPNIYASDFLVPQYPPSPQNIYPVTALCSEGPMFRKFYVQKVLSSEGHMFRRFYVQKVLYSEGSMFRRSYVQKYLFRRSYAQKVRVINLSVTIGHKTFLQRWIQSFFRISNILATRLHAQPNFFRHCH